MVSYSQLTYGKTTIMRTYATLNNFSAPAGKSTILRNLNRILDIVVLDIDEENSAITFLYTSKSVLEKVKRELKCIGYPIRHMIHKKDYESDVKAIGTLA